VDDISFRRWPVRFNRVTVRRRRISARARKELREARKRLQWGHTVRRRRAFHRPAGYLTSKSEMRQWGHRLKTANIRSRTGGSETRCRWRFNGATVRRRRICLVRDSCPRASVAASMGPPSEDGGYSGRPSSSSGPQSALHGATIRRRRIFHHKLGTPGEGPAPIQWNTVRRRRICVARGTPDVRATFQILMTHLLQ